MVRTRDLFLFVAVLVFLTVAIMTTLWLREGQGKNDGGGVPFVSDTASTSAELATTKGIDRAARIADLRAKIAADTSTLALNPSVEGPTVSEAPPEKSELEVDPEVPSSGPQRCLYPDDTLAKVPRWPLSGVSFTVSGVSRLVNHATVVTPPSGTSTAGLSETVNQVLATLPLVPVAQATPHCLPSEIIGISISGYLLFNSEVRPFRQLSSEMLIGYARDGYPIYGPYQGELDECGGYQAPTGYRYSLSPERNYILGCFTASPTNFTL